jgi:hypothetical protein
MLFRLNHLAIGKELPEFDGIDVHGKRFKPSDFRGNVVVVLANNSTNYSPPLKAVLEKYADQPLQLIGVIPNDTREEFEKITASVGSRWVTTWDQGHYSPILTNWFHEGAPYAYVADHRGVIRHYAVMFDDIDELVAPLLAEIR